MQPRSGVSISTSAALHFLYKPFVALSRSRLVWQPIHCTVKCKSVEKPKQSDFRGKLSPPFWPKEKRLQMALTLLARSIEGKCIVRES